MVKRNSSHAVHYSNRRATKNGPYQRDKADKYISDPVRAKNTGTRSRFVSILYIVFGLMIILALVSRSSTNTQTKPISQKPPKKAPSHQLPLVQAPISNTTLASLNNPLNCPNGVILNTVAHEDDDILFMNPTIQNDITAGRCIRTVFFTAGDDGRDTSYWTERELGPDAAYAAMFNAPDNWTSSPAMILGHQVIVHSLVSKPQVSLIFLRLPDGDLSGQGFASTGFESLLKLRTGQINTIRTIDDTSTYSGLQLISVLHAVMKLDKPSIINTQASSANLASGDHSDHQSVGYFTSIAELTYGSSSMLHHYIGYQIGSMDQNLTQEQINQKALVFNVYQQHDSMICNASEGCFNANIYQRYLSREYEQGISER